MSDTLRQVTIRPLISYPREARPGQTYLLSVDLQLEEPGWPYNEEEYPISFLLSCQPPHLFRYVTYGESEVILHRFGGTYGPATFLLMASEQEQAGVIHLTLLNRSGLS